MPATLYILRILTEEQVLSRIKFLEALISDGAEELHGKLEDYSKIIKLASEEGELEYVEETEVAFDPKAHGRLFSDKIVELLSTLSTRSFNSISELARFLGRDIANVYRDLRWLEELGFVSLEHVGRRIIPRLLVIEYGIRLY